MKRASLKLIDFTHLDLNEKEMILKWRNNPNIRKWMYNSDIISLKNHLNFIDNLATDMTKRYFFVKNRDKSIGVIYFTDIDIKSRSAEFGLYTNPKLYGQGKVLMQTIMNYAVDILKLKVLYAEVFKDNIKALQLYKKYNFYENGFKTVGNKDVLCMQHDL